MKTPGEQKERSTNEAFTLSVHFTLSSTGTEMARSFKNFLRGEFKQN